MSGDGSESHSRGCLKKWKNDAQFGASSITLFSAAGSGVWCYVTRRRPGKLFRLGCSSNKSRNVLKVVVAVVVVVVVEVVIVVVQKPTPPPPLAALWTHSFEPRRKLSLFA